MNEIEVIKNVYKGLRDGVYRRLLDTYVGASYLEGGRILDVGCGYCPWLIEAINYNPKLLVGGDIDKARLHYSLENSTVLASKANLLEIDACYLPFRDRSFDVVLHYLVLYLVPNDDLAIKEIARVLDRGGVAFLGLHGIGFHLFNAIRRHKRRQFLSIMPCAILTVVNFIFNKKLLFKQGAHYQTVGQIRKYAKKYGLEVTRIERGDSILSLPQILLITLTKKS